jgi:carbonic anhydrase
MVPPNARLLLVALLPLLGACAAPQHHGDWSYEGMTGPAHWGHLSPDYAACALGREQSPIALPGPAQPFADLGIAYRATPLHVLDNGHSFQVNTPGAGTLQVGADTYELVQLHFHHPSEHTLAGQAYAMELHLVHKSRAGKLAVVAVLLKPGAASAAYEPIWRLFPEKEGTAHHNDGPPLDPTTLLPPARKGLTYPGSLTTPPCTEGVSWFVLDAPVELSAEQIARFAERFPDDARPVQPRAAAPAR